MSSFKQFFIRINVFEIICVSGHFLVLFAGKNCQFISCLLKPLQSRSQMHTRLFFFFSLLCWLLFSSFFLFELCVFEIKYILFLFLSFYAVATGLQISAGLSGVFIFIVPSIWSTFFIAWDILSSFDLNCYYFIICHLSWNHQRICNCL